MFDISWFFAGMEQFKYTVTKNAACKLIGVALMFMFVKKQEDLLLYIIIITASTMLGNLSMWLYVPRFITKVDFKTLRFKKHFHETLIYFIPSIATSVYTVLDRLLIGVITKNKAENGCYHYTMQIINMMKVLTFSSLNMVLGSRIAYLFAEEKFDEIKARIRDSINYILFMGIGICFGLIGVAGRFVPIFLGAGYDRVVTMLQLMSPIVVVIGVSNCLGSQYYTPSGNRKLSAKFIIIGALVNLTLNLILIHRFWGYGAIVASLIAETVITILYFRYCSGYLTMDTFIREGWKKLIAGIVMLAVIKQIDRFITSNAAALIVEVAAGFAVYCVMILALHDTFISEIVLGKILKRGKSA
jgi:O-antigen/teichoic acid export membrane protein